MAVGRALGHGLACAIALLAPAAAWAWGDLLLLDPPPDHTKSAAGAAVLMMPRAPGTASPRIMALPALDLAGSSGWFISTDSGVGWNLSRRADWQAGWRLWPQFGRDAAASPVGVRPIGDRLQAEWFANWAPNDAVLLQSAVLNGAGRSHNGLHAEWGVTSGVPLGGELVGVGLSVSWANGRWRNSYYGVSDAESVASGLRPWSLAGGWQDAAVTVSTEHRFDDHWRVTGQWIRARLLGRSAESPLTRARWQGGGSVSLLRDF